MRVFDGWGSWRGMAELQKPYPARKGRYTAKDLKYLATSLGFPNTLLLDAFQSTKDENHSLQNGLSVDEKSITKLLESKVLDDKLEKVFNMYSTKYNVKLIKKVMSLLRHKQMTFSCISGARVAFEVQASADGSGMPSDLDTVMQALKLVEKVMAPTRLSAEILKKQLVSEFLSRFQMYEFFAIVALCERESDVEIEMQSSCTQEGMKLLGSNSDLELPNFEEILMTDYQKILAYLDRKYRASIYKKVEAAPVVLDSQHIVSPTPRREPIRSSYQQYCTLTPSLEESQSQLHQARIGFSNFTADQQSKVTTRNASRSSMPTKDHVNVSDPLLAVHFMDQAHYLGAQRPVKLCLRRRLRKAKYSTQFSDVNVSVDFTGHGSTQQSVGEDVEQKELVDTLARVCVPSVMRARAAVKSSMADLPQLITPMGSSSLSGSQLDHHLPTSCQLHCAPIVSEHELKVQQVLIDELEWSSRSLKRNTHTKNGEPDATITHTDHKAANTVSVVLSQRNGQRKRTKSDSNVAVRRRERESCPSMSFSSIPVFQRIVKCKM